MGNGRKTIIITARLLFLFAIIAVFYAVRKNDLLAQFTPLDFNRCLFAGWSILWTAIVLAAAWVSGAWLLSLFRFTELTILEDVLFSLALGFSVLIAVAFSMAALGLYRLELLLMILVALFIAFSRFAVRRMHQLRAPAPQAPDALPRWFRGFAIAALVVFLLPNFLGTLTPPSTWDELVYHLVIPKTYIAHGGFARLDYLVYFDIPHNINLLYGFSLMADSPQSAHLLHFSFGILTAGLLIAFCRRFYGEISGWFALLIFLTTPVVMLETRAAMVDVAMAFFFLAAVYAAFLWWESGRARFLTLSAIFTGIALGCKYQGIYCFAALFAMLLILPPKTDKRFSRRHVRALILFVALSGLIVAPWLLKNARATGNPVYPNLYRIFDGKDWSPDLSTHLRIWLQSMGMGKDIRGFLLLPWRLTVRGAPTYSRFSGTLTPFYFLLLPMLIFVFRHRRVTGILLLLFLIYLVIWFLGSQQMRFLIPALPLLALVSGDILAQLFRKGSTLKTNTLLPLVFVLVGLVSISADLSDVYLTGSYVGQTFGTDDRDHFLEYARGVDIQPMIIYMNQHLPSDARVLMLFENRGYYLARSYIADGTFEVSRIVPWFTDAASPGETFEMLKRHGITHVLLNENYSGGSIEKFYPDFSEKFETFRQSYLRIATRIGKAVLFKLGA